MKFITKIKCWLIKKLGGYTVEDFTRRVSDAERVWNNIGDIKERRIRNLKNCIDCWNSAYTAEHKAYLALLNAHNASAEAAQKMLAPIEMAKALKEYCAERDDCEGCELHDTEHCKLSYKACPEYWEAK